MRNRIRRVTQDCPTCKGTGQIREYDADLRPDFYECGDCGGDGMARDDLLIDEDDDGIRGVDELLRDG